MEEEFDFTNAEAVTEFLSSDKDRQKKISNYIKEYSGSDEGRKLRDLQIGKRESYSQGKDTVIPERIKIQYQKKIVRQPVGFLFGNAPTIKANDIENPNGIKILDTIKSNRVYNKLQGFAESVMSTTIGVFILSKGGIDGTEIKIRSYDENNGKYTPQYDVYGDLIAFYWQFEIPGKEGHNIWIFTDTEIHKYYKGKYVTSVLHGFKVIPVAFVVQNEPEWWDEKEMIDRIEMIASKLAGSNNHFAFPILKLLGGVEKDENGNDINLIDIADDGKSLLMGHAIKEGQVIQANAEFLQRDTGVDSIKLEIEYLKEFINSISETADLSFDNVKGIGAISGRALLLMLQDAINKAKRKKGDYQIAIERIISIIKNGFGIEDEDLTFEIEFNLSIPEDIKEVIDMLYNATGGKATMAQETGVQNNPLVKNPSEEMEKLREQEAAAMGETFNV